MLQLILSHWVMYLYLPAVVILLVLVIVFRKQSTIVYRKLRQLPARTARMAGRWRPRTRPVR